MITIEQLKQISPRMARNPKTCAELFPFLVKAMKEFDINTPARICAFLAQVLHESGHFRYMSEIWGPTPQQLKYEPPSALAKKLGNTEPGDGRAFSGHGPIQITGRQNHADCGKALGLDLISNPELITTYEHGFRSAGWFWKTKGLNQLADAGDFEKITRIINGGTNGREDRNKNWATAKKVLGVS